MDIKTKLQIIFQDVFDSASLNLFDDMTSKDVENWDSISHITLIHAIETQFHIRFSTQELMESQNVGNLVEMIKNKLT